MYYIKKYDIFSKVPETIAKTDSPAQAYEMAHEYDAGFHCGSDEEDTDKLDELFIICIEDDNGKDVWSECCLARCPAVGLLQ